MDFVRSCMSVGVGISDKVCPRIQRTCLVFSDVRHLCRRRDSYRPKSTLCGNNEIDRGMQPRNMVVEGEGYAVTFDV